MEEHTETPTLPFCETLDISFAETPEKSSGESGSDKITWSVRAVDAIAKEMMRGLDNERYKSVSEEQRQAFIERNRALIERIWPFVPRGFSSVGGAVCKCAIAFGPELAIEFLRRFKEMLFKGRTDPVYVYRKWFDSKRRVSKDRFLTYNTTMTACAAFCQQKPLTRLPARGQPRDLFEWDENWEFVGLGYRQKTMVRPSNISDKEWYSCSETAEVTGYSQYTIRNACRLGRIPAVKGSKSTWLISRQEVLGLRAHGLPADSHNPEKECVCGPQENI